MRALILGIVLLGAANGCPNNPPVKPFPFPTIPPTPEPTSKPTPVPTPMACVIPDGPHAVAASPRPPAEYATVLNSTLQSLYGGEPGDRTPIREPMEASLNRVVDTLKSKGMCAGIQAGADEVCILEPDGSCQGYHVFTCDPGCTSGVVGWAPGSVRDTWHLVGGPDPGPGPVAGCPALTNLRVFAHQNNPGSVIVDVTPRGPDCARCASISKGCDNGVCPLGPEGTPEFDAQRIACETAAGPYKFTFNGAPCDADGVPCFHQSDNPLSVKVLAPGLVAVSTANGVGNQVQVNP